MVDIILARTFPDYKKWEEEYETATKITQVEKAYQNLDICLMLDMTGSMGDMIEASKRKLVSIIDNVVNESENLQVRAAFVGYRDIGDSDHFYKIDFTSDVKHV